MQSARLTFSSIASWQRWEAGRAPMPPGLWALYCLAVEGRRQRSIGARATASEGLDVPLPQNDEMRERAARDAFERWLSFLVESRPPE